MILLWTQNPYPPSQLIRWGLDTNVSHFAILDDEDMVLDSTLTTGVRLTTLSQFLRHNKIMYAYSIPSLSHAENKDILTALKISVLSADYDWKGVSFLIASVIIFRKLLGKPLPKENKWADKADVFCSEVLTTPRLMHVLKCECKIDFLKYGSQMLTPDLALNEFHGNILCKDEMERFRNGNTQIKNR